MRCVRSKAKTYFLCLFFKVGNGQSASNDPRAILVQGRRRGQKLRLTADTENSRGAKKLREEQRPQKFTAAANTQDSHNNSDEDNQNSNSTTRKICNPVAVAALMTDNPWPHTHTYAQRRRRRPEEEEEERQRGIH